MVSAGIVTTENSFFVKFNFAKKLILEFAIRNFFKVKSVLCYSKCSLTVQKIFWSENENVGTYLNFYHFIYLTMYIGVIWLCSFLSLHDVLKLELYSTNLNLLAMSTLCLPYIYLFWIERILFDHNFGYRRPPLPSSRLCQKIRWGEVISGGINLIPLTSESIRKNIKLRFQIWGSNFRSCDVAISAFWGSTGGGSSVNLILYMPKHLLIPPHH